MNAFLIGNLVRGLCTVTLKVGEVTNSVCEALTGQRTRGAVVNDKNHSPESLKKATKWTEVAARFAEIQAEDKAKAEKKAADKAARDAAKASFDGWDLP